MKEGEEGGKWRGGGKWSLEDGGVEVSNVGSVVVEGALELEENGAPVLVVLVLDEEAVEVLVVAPPVVLQPVPVPDANPTHLPATDYYQGSCTSTKEMRRTRASLDSSELTESSGCIW